MFLKWKRGDHAVAAVQKFRCFERERDFNFIERREGEREGDISRVRLATTISMTIDSLGR